MSQKKIIDAYINIELQLGNNDRVKKIFQSYIQKFPNDENIWFNFCKFEESLEEYNVAEVLYINSIKFMKENKNDKGLYKMYTEFINFYTNLSVNSKDKKEKNSINNKIKKLYAEMLKNKLIIKYLDKEKEIEIWNNYAEIYYRNKKYDEMDKIYKKCLMEIINEVTDEELKVKYSEIIINNWTSHYEGNKERLDRIKELLSYNDDNEEVEENEEKIIENEYNNTNITNKNKNSSLMEKAIECKEKNKVTQIINLLIIKKILEEKKNYNNLLKNKIKEEKKMRINYLKKKVKKV